MSQSKPSPRTLEPDDERKIQMFLERASAIVLERPSLDAAQWQLMVNLAEELQLSDEQLTGIVHDLRQRGVIAEIDLGPPAPPPPPGASDTPGSASSSGTVQEADFSLTPPVTNAEPASPLPPPPPPVATTREITQPEPGPAEPDPISRFLTRARSIIAEQRGFSPRTPALLAAAAQEAGLSDEEAARALQQLQPAASARPMPPPAPPSPPSVPSTTVAGREAVGSADSTKSNRRRWREEGEPPPEPLPPSKRPAEICREYMAASLAQITDGRVPPVLQRKLLKHATAVLGLAHVFARHILLEEATSMGLRLDAATNSQALAEDLPEECVSDPKLQQFLDRCIPILAQQRGITARSRVLMNAIAHELGLTEQQVEEAMAVAQFRSATVGEEDGLRQQERLDGFRDLARGTLLSLPRKLLTHDVEQSLLRHGEERHGIKPELAKVAIREVCAGLKIRQISQQQAHDHIQRLVQEKLNDHARLPREVQERIESEGDQWGLSCAQVTAIIQEQVRQRDQQSRAERNFAQGALVAAGVAALVVVAFLGWVWLADTMSPAPPELAEEPPRIPSLLKVDEKLVDTSWWGEELEFAIGNARIEFRPRRQIFIQIESHDPSVRRSAYGSLVSELFDASHTAAQRNLLSSIIAQCHARDPDPDSARRLLDDLLRHIPKSEKELRVDEQFYADTWVATRAAVALVNQARDQRQSDAIVELSQATGRTLEVGTSSEVPLPLALEGVAERLYRMLIARARTEPKQVAALQQMVSQQVAPYLEASQLEKLQTEFLVVVLSGASTTWRDYTTLINATIQSKSPLNTVRMLDIFEKTTDTELQSFLAERLLARAGVNPTDRDVVTVANEVRQSLGVAGLGQADSRRAKFLVSAESLLAESRADLNDPEQMLAEWVQLAYQATLACALSQGAAGEAAFDKWSSQDIAARLAPETKSDGEFTASKRTLEPINSRMVNERLNMLSHARTGPVARAGFVEYLANMVEQIHDLAPDQSEKLAQYLLMKKTAEEQRAILKNSRQIGRWKSVRLAVADQLDTVGLDRAQLQEFVSQLLRREYKLGEGAAGREALRAELMRDVLVDLQREESGRRDKFQVYDLATPVLFDCYTEQAQVRRVPTASAESKTPTAVVQTLIEQALSQLESGKLNDDDRQLVTRLGVDVRAIDYLSANDLQRLALLERVWLRLLALETYREQRDRQAAAFAILDELASRDQAARHVLVQLRDGQAALLSMWVLRHRAT